MNLYLLLFNNWAFPLILGNDWQETMVNHSNGQHDQQMQMQNFCFLALLLPSLTLESTPTNSSGTSQFVRIPACVHWIL